MAFEWDPLWRTYDIWQKGTFSASSLRIYSPRSESVFLLCRETDFLLDDKTAPSIFISISHTISSSSSKIVPPLSTAMQGHGACAVASCECYVRAHFTPPNNYVCAAQGRDFWFHAPSQSETYVRTWRRESMIDCLPPFSSSSSFLTFSANVCLCS